MGNLKTYHFLFPVKVAEILDTWEGNPPFKNFHIDNIKLLLSIISTHIKKDDNGNFFAPLKMQYLRKRVWNAEKYIHLLKDAGIIQTFGGFVRNDHSYRYQFTDIYQSPYLKIELTNQKLIRTISKVNASEGRKTSRKYPLQKQIIQSLTINSESAEKLVREKCKNVNELNNALGAIARIEQGDPTFSVDDKVFRLHTNLTNFPKIARSELKINGKKLSGVDIGNSVPYMANKIFSDPESCGKFYPEPDKYPIIMLKCLRLPQQRDVKRYTLLTSKAQFYKCLETEFNKRGCNYDTSNKEGKKVFRQKVFQILFSENRYSCKEKKIFIELFPNVNRAFSVLRMYERNYFNYMLGRMESHIVLDVILDYLNNKYPEMFASQIYDNIIATDDIETVSMVMTEKLTGFIGVTPTLKTENF